MKKQFDYSPFKFLSPFEFGEDQYFFGREYEVKQLVNRVIESSLVVFFGPSGSGKTSLIKCSFLKELDVSEQQFYYIRRIDNFIDSISNSLINSQKLNTYLNDIKSANKILNKLEDIIDEEAKEYRKNLLLNKKDKLKVKQLESNYKSNRNSRIKEFGKARELQSNKENILCNEILSKHSTGESNYILLDQFEELFENGTKDEVESIGILLRLIEANPLPITIIISIREDSLSRLSLIEKFNPNILKFKTALDHPSENRLRTIIEKSFNKFNINQNIDEDKQKKRIDLIIKYLRIEDSRVATKHFGKEDFYLPFLQIYLDRLYRRDFKDTYPEGLFIEKDTFPIIEFEINEIMRFGNIDMVLRRYLEDIAKQIASTTNKVDVNTIYKFLKHFITPNETKRTDIKLLESEDGSYTIEDAKILLSVEKLSAPLYDSIKSESILSKLVSFLIDSRLLVKSENRIELSHDIIAKWISTLPVENDVNEILRNSFISEYEYYQSNKVKSNFVSKDLISKIGEDIYKIFPPKTKEFDKQYESKIEYWKESKKFRKGQNNRLINIYRLVAFLFLLIIIFLCYFIQENINSKTEIENKHLETFGLRMSSEKTRDIYKGVGDAYEVGKHDLTKAYTKLQSRDIENSRGLIRVINNIVDNSSKANFSILDNYSKDLLNNYIKRPFYYWNIPIDPSDHILSTKSRKIGGDDKLEYLVYTQLRNKILISKLNIQNRTHQITDTLKGNIAAFKPNNNGKEMIYSDNVGIHYFKLNSEYEILEPVTIYKCKGIKGIQQFDDNYLAFEEGSNRLLKVVKNNDVFSTEIISLRNLCNINTIKKGPDNSIIIIGDKKCGSAPYIYMYNSNYDIIDSLNLDNGFLHQYDIKAIKVVDKYALLAGRRYIYKLDLRNLKWPKAPEIVVHHPEEITSLDFSNDYYLVGSRDRTASLYWDNDNIPYNEIFNKEYLGHSDAILNVSFLDNNDLNSKQFILTSGQDGTLKVWENSNLFAAESHITGAIEISKLDYFNDSLFVAFNFQSDSDKLVNLKGNDRSGYILKLASEELDSQHIELYKRGGMAKSVWNKFWTKGNIHSFDLYCKNEIVGVSGKEITSLQVSGSKAPSLKYNLSSTINDICFSKDSLTVLATSNGMVVIDNLSLTRNKYNPPNLRLSDTLENIVFNTVDIHPTKNWIIGTSDDRNVYLWKYDDKIIETLTYHTDRIKDALFSSTGEYFVSGSWDNTAVIWVEINQSFVPLTDHDQIIKSHISDIEDIDISNNDIIATASSDNTVHLHKISKSGTNYSVIRQKSPISHLHSIRTVCFADTATIFTGDNKGLIRKWNLNSFTPTPTFDEQMTKKNYESDLFKVNARKAESKSYKFVVQGRPYLVKIIEGKNWKTWFLIESDIDGIKKKRSAKIKDENRLALCGRIKGKDENRIAFEEEFFIGSQDTIWPTKSGRLYLYANDSKLGYWNNLGEITVSIEDIY